MPVGDFWNHGVKFDANRKWRKARPHTKGKAKRRECKKNAFSIESKKSNKLS